MPPKPTHQCSVDAASADLNGKHNCPGENGTPDFQWWGKHPGIPPKNPNALKERRKLGISDGFNFGVILLPYCRDWGERHGAMRRRKAYVTCLHSFARAADRAYALAALEAFVPNKDTYHQNFTAYLITATPFAGYRWHAHALLNWCDYAQERADKQGAQRSLDVEPAAHAAIAWCADVRQLWDISTVEHFPYSATDLIGYWRAPTTAATLPATFPVSPDLVPPP